MAQVRWLTDGEQAVWRSYLEVTRLLDDRLQHQLSEAEGLSLAEYEILVQLSETPQHGLRMAQLADRVVNSRSRLTHTVGRLEQRGLVSRRPCPDDGRGVLCELTDAGMSTLEAAAPGHVACVRELLFDPLDGADVEHLGTALTKVRARLRDG
jgi:DNA-binding MarR family transcriptional regulator